MKLKRTWIPFVLFFVAIMGLRIYQILSVGVASVRVQWDNFEMICFVFSAVASAMIIIMSYISKDAPDVFVIKKSRSVGVISILTAALIEWNAINEFNSYLSGGNEWVKLVSSIVGFLAGFAFITISFNFINEKNYFEKHKLLSLIPTLWALTLLLKLFFKYNSAPTTILNVSDSLAKICILFFLFNQSKLFASLFNATTFKKLFYFGFSAVLFTMVYTTNYLAVTIDLGRKLSLTNIVELLLELAIGVYILCTIYSIKTGQNLVADEKIELSDSTPELVHNDNINNKTTNDVEEEKPDMAEVDRLIEDIKNETAEKQQNFRE